MGKHGRVSVLPAAEPALAPTQANGRPKRSRRVLSTAVKLIIAAFVLVQFGLPALASGRDGLKRLIDVNPALLILGLGLELAALISYSLMTRAALPANAIRFVTLTRIQLATKAVTNIVPGGSAAGSALGYRMLTLAGVEGADAGFALATVGLTSAVVLNVLLWVVLAVSIPAIGYRPIYVTVGVIGLFVMAIFFGLVLALMKGHEQAERGLRMVARRVNFLDEERAGNLVRRLAVRLRQLLSDRSLLRRLGIWALANWLLDAAALWVFIRAFSGSVRLDGLVVAFCVANVLAAVPLTPGGLGVVETALTTFLVIVGSSAAAATLGVNTYRIAQFWLPIPLGAVLYLTLRLGPWRIDRDSRLGDLRTEAASVVRSGESVYDWYEQFEQPLGPSRPVAPQTSDVSP